MKFKPNPVWGSTRIIEKYLILPRTCTDKKTRSRQTRWLERAKIEQEYCLGFGWSDKDWID